MWYTVVCLSRNRVKALDYGDVAYTSALPFGRNWAFTFKYSSTAYACTYWVNKPIICAFILG